MNGLICGILIFVWMLIVACGDPHAGGSVGTDNPQVAVVQISETLNSMDSIRISIWSNDQDAKNDPSPLWDTVVYGSTVVTIDSSALNLPTNSWNIQAVATNGEMSVASNSLADTLYLSLLQSSANQSYNFSIENMDTLPWDNIVRDTIPTVPFSAEVIWSKDSLSQEAQSMIIPPTAYYIQVLGSSLVFTVTDSNLILPLGTGTYTLLYLDRRGIEIERHEIVVP